MTHSPNPLSAVATQASRPHPPVQGRTPHDRVIDAIFNPGINLTAAIREAIRAGKNGADQSA